MLAQFYSFCTTVIVILAIDYYSYFHLSKLKFLQAKRKFFKYLWWSTSILSLCLIFVSIFFKLPFWTEAYLTFLPLSLIIAKLFCLPFLLLKDILYVFKKLVKPKTKEEPINEKQEADLSRSEFLLKTGILVASVPLMALTGGFISGAYDYQVRHQKLRLPHLPNAFNGLKIAQISDIHSGSFYNKVAVSGGVDLLLAEKPDLIFFTGDLVNDFAAEATDYLDIFSRVKAPLGVFSILGNHDYGDYHFKRKHFFTTNPISKEQNLSDVKAIHRSLGWQLLLNESRELVVDGEKIYIIGVENWGVESPFKYGNMEMAMKDVKDKSVLKLLLSHDPSHWRGEILPLYPEIDMMFSGHTHGGQFGVRKAKYQWSPIEYKYSEWAGLYTEKNQMLYVNAGYGFLGYPGRVGILPEITIFELSNGNS
ncbi:metallophosphoesterase [Pedobacter montanisoli]|uniref:Metallophosphoesterase n=1 Tax=Pedobacter montanisoli TaxID=2923277 RepID=A0ABS9ZXC8_9SPHI|nr:metallophosphoesterase [Pedobacter montanisoli]MCJ0742954.1 metallophosphoesterase [Pedobacter montanisoli]